MIKKIEITYIERFLRILLIMFLPSWYIRSESAEQQGGHGADHLTARVSLVGPPSVVPGTGAQLKLDSNGEIIFMFPSTAFPNGGEVFLMAPSVQVLLTGSGSISFRRLVRKIISLLPKKLMIKGSRFWQLPGSRVDPPRQRGTVGTPHQFRVQLAPLGSSTARYGSLDRRVTASPGGQVEYITMEDFVGVFPPDRSFSASQVSRAFGQ
jgi:hypothetical protein